MRTKLFSFFLVLLASAGTIRADIIPLVKIGDLYYNIDTINSTAELTLGYYSSPMTSVTIPVSVEYEDETYIVTSIGASALSGVEMTSVVIPYSVKTIGNHAFYRCLNLDSVYIPVGVLTIGDDAFAGCPSLTHITVPNSVRTMGTGVFENCTGLVSYSLSQSVTGIEERTFFGCSSLTSMIINSNITYIGSRAFDGCTSITTARCVAVTPPELGTHVFYNMDCPNIPLIVPAGSYDEYRAADQWKEFNLISQVVDGVDDVTSNKSGTSKLLHNGQILIRRADRTYTLTGTEVK